MNNRRAFFAAVGCLLLFVIVVVTAFVGLFAVGNVDFLERAGIPEAPGGAAEEVPEELPEAVATFTPAPGEEESTEQTQRRPEPLTELYDQASPGVVNIRVSQLQGEEIVGQGAGSGFILDDEGHIVTNNHVVANADEVIVVFSNGLEVSGEVIGTDADSDLAVLQVDQIPEEAHPLPLGRLEEVEAGEEVVAIGNPFALQSSMTFGIVSAVGRMIPSGTTPFSIPEAIQTDAAINPGNSGGPLLNMQGEVIGVNAQIATGGAPANVGVGFAIPVSIVRLVVPALIERGEFVWPWLGVSGGNVTLELQQTEELEAQQGAFIAEVVEGGPAAEARLQPGDVVVSANGEDIRSFADLLNVVAFSRPDEMVELTVVRDGERQDVTVQLAPRPREFGPDTQSP